MTIERVGSLPQGAGRAHAQRVKLLKLCTSDELAGDIPDGQRAYRVAERVITERTGEPVETALQPIWPTRRLPSLLEGWMETQHPDAVLFIVSPYWTTFASVPLLLQRRLGAPGRWLGGWMTRVGAAPETRGAWWVRLARGASVRLLPGAYEFEPEDIGSVVEACLRVVLANESVDVVVRGPLVALGHHGSARSLRRAEARRVRTDVALKGVCAKLHVAFVGRPDSASHRADRAQFTGDLVHTDVDGHRDRGELEGAAVAEAWLAGRGRGASA